MTNAHASTLNPRAETPGRVVILGTGGTIAGRASRPEDGVGYVAGSVRVADLVAEIPGLASVPLESEQVAQLDSKDMDADTWQRLAERVAFHLARPEVQGIVVTHGTDTLEETAWFLHRVLSPAKPVVITAAMRPATALMRDGPQNLLDAVTVARWPGAQGVAAVLAGEVLAPGEVRKLHPYRVDAFGSSGAGPLARIQEGQVLPLRPWPVTAALGLACILTPVHAWPRVDIVVSHAGCDGSVVAALRALGAQGLVVEGTGNGTVHHRLESALREAQAAGVRVVRSSRCLAGDVVGDPPGALVRAAGLSPACARVEVLLQLLAGAPPKG